MAKSWLAHRLIAVFVLASITAPGCGGRPEDGRVGPAPAGQQGEGGRGDAGTAVAAMAPLPGEAAGTAVAIEPGTARPAAVDRAAATSASAVVGGALPGPAEGETTTGAGANRPPSTLPGGRGGGSNAGPRPVTRPQDGRPVLLTAAGDTIPWAPMGKPRTRSPLESSPGYERVIDPDSSAVLTGRREVILHDRRLGEGGRSAEELALWILDALRESDKEQLKALHVTYQEYQEILWPEFPESRPITRLEHKDAWFYHERTSIAGINQGLSQYGGVPLEFDRITYDTGFAPYTNFNLYHGVRIHARTPAGEAIVLDFAESFVECRGTWKVYIFKD